MIEVRQTELFRNWYANFSDLRGRARIRARIGRLTYGHFGDTKPLGDGVSELRIDFGPGYRMYFTREGNTVVILLCGGDKDTQQRDIKRAKALAAQLKE
jgi:putative addiction module killer protein